ncbi:hypothetical protein DAPPUDRAFT_254498 [Daphnia pulex]|uniref:Uncharacterized protein n=1 Tax=Daphnia pulex TaxID=6669 RepID=E9H768_DAPPU|nr:hypothetical protein DAPPUDRAFT_254498 [Daphnia pulex]|eukprot:EFX72324.1 hypothetical protein DAPPUDRAFT_254498 [Daphnia pulex]
MDKYFAIFQTPSFTKISKKWKKIKLLKDADLVHQNSHHQQQISTNEDNLQRPQEDEEIESYHLVNDCLDDVQIYTPPPFASAGSRKSSEEPNLITAGSIGMIDKYDQRDPPRDLNVNHNRHHERYRKRE